MLKFNIIVNLSYTKYFVCLIHSYNYTMEYLYMWVSKTKAVLPSHSNNKKHHCYIMVYKTIATFSQNSIHYLVFVIDNEPKKFTYIYKKSLYIMQYHTFMWAVVFSFVVFISFSFFCNYFISHDETCEIIYYSIRYTL